MAVTPQDMRKYYTAYENMRRKRHGFHKPKNGLVTELLNKYRDEYENHSDRMLTVDKRYAKFKSYIKSLNTLIDEMLETQDDIKDDEHSYKRSVKRMGSFYAWRKHTYLKSGPQKRNKKKVHSQKVFEKEFDYFGSLEAYINGIFYIRLKEDEDQHYIYGNRDGTLANVNELDEWLYGDGSYSETEQYQRKIAQLSIGQNGDPQSKKWAAYKSSRKFAQDVAQYNDCFLYYIEKKKLKLAKNEYLPPARMMVHETVRISKADKVKSYEKPYSSKPHLDSDLVSNIGKVLRYFDENNVKPAEVYSIFKELGGPSRIFRPLKSKKS